MFAPRGTPGEIIAKVNADVERILAMPDVKEKGVTLGYRFVGGSPEKLAAFSQERDRQVGRGRPKRLAEVITRGGQLADARIALNVAMLRWSVQASCLSMVPCDNWKWGHPAFLSEGIAAAECLLCPSYLRPVSHQRE